MGIASESQSCWRHVIGVAVLYNIQAKAGTVEKMCIRDRPYTVEAACRVRKVLPARSREEAEDFFYEEAGAVEDHFPEAVLEIISICEGE